jgi:hypothetical protein
MNTAKNSGRKNFKCIFNDYITDENRDAVVQSVISQFQGYNANPEVTLIDRGFVLSLDLSADLSELSVRDKILWNRFIERVTTQDSIRKIQILKLPQMASQQGSVGAFGPHATPSGNTGVDEVDGNPHQEYRIDNADRPDGPPFTASVKLADPSELIPAIYGPGAEHGTPTDPDLRSDITNPTAEHNTKLDSGKSSSRLYGFRVISFQSDTGGSFTLNKPNDYGADINNTHALQGTNEDLAMLPRGNFYNTDINNERGTRTGVETVSRGDEASSAPLALASKDTEQKPVFPGPNAATYAVLGIDEEDDPTHAMGGIATGSIHFGLNETYDYLGDVDGEDF